MESSLEKKQRVNLLMDCYCDLLTDKQQDYLTLYYEEDLSNLKRAVASLEDYESKLHLLEKHVQRMDLIKRIEDEQNTSREQLDDYLEMLKRI